MRLDSPIFQDADAARVHLEAQRWPNGPVCPHCGNADPVRITAMQGKAHRAGLYNCMECRDQFTVTVGTVFERSKIALNKWLLATFLLSSSKKGMSAHQLHRMLGVTYKTAWFMAHRIREAMKEDVKSAGPIGGEGKTVEADETYIGKRETPRVSAQRKGLAPESNLLKVSAGVSYGGCDSGDRPESCRQTGDYLSFASCKGEGRHASSSILPRLCRYFDVPLSAFVPIAEEERLETRNRRNRTHEVYPLRRHCRLLALEVGFGQQPHGRR